MADEPEVEVTVTPSDTPEEETPEVIDTGDTVVVVPDGGDDGEVDRWVENERRMAEMQDTIRMLADSQLAAQSAAISAAEEAAAAAAAAEEAAAEADDEDDIIVPKRTHAWFRPWREWGDR